MLKNITLNSKTLCTLRKNCIYLHADENLVSFKKPKEIHNTF